MLLMIYYRLALGVLFIIAHNRSELIFRILSGSRNSYIHASSTHGSLALNNDQNCKKRLNVCRQHTNSIEACVHVNETCQTKFAILIQSIMRHLAITNVSSHWYLFTQWSTIKDLMTNAVLSYKIVLSPTQ